MNQSIKRVTASLLLEFCKVDAEKRSAFWEKWDEKIQKIEQKMSERGGNWQTDNKKAAKYWRSNNSITADFYWFLRRNFPVPIPYILFFPSREIKINYNVEYNKYKGDLADKWLKDIFSRESFYKRNKEYFTRAEVKYFLICDCAVFGNCYDLIDYFFITKIKANDLDLSLDVFHDFRDCFTNQIVIEYFKFLCNNKKCINDKEMREINEFLKSEYISVGKNIDFKNYTYHSLKRLSDEWRISNMIKNRFEYRCGHEVTEGYIFFVCKNVKDIRDKKEEIRDICDFLETEYINNDLDFDFENMTWRELKRLSDEWHLEIRERDDRASEEHKKKILNTEWKKSSIKDFNYKKDGKTWTIKEITTGRALFEEGKYMRHCVFNYAYRCIDGYCYIFSVSCESGRDGSEERAATVEISRGMKLVQARGQENARIGNETASIIKIWADENKINCGNYLSNRNRFYGQVA